MNAKWRFPASNHGTEKGISSGDAEAFKKSPYSSFAREILQNSIDVQLDKSKPVVVEFSDFEVKTEEIPGVDELKEAMSQCISYWNHKKDYVSEYNSMLECLNQGYVKCLRVSDFNTTGLVGVESLAHENNKFLALCKGSGVSEKGDGLSGGSKGVGKNASFLMSDIKTVIYSTQACSSIDGKKGTYIGSIGVADFVSGYEC